MHMSSSWFCRCRLADACPIPCSKSCSPSIGCVVNDDYVTFIGSSLLTEAVAELAHIRSFGRFAITLADAALRCVVRLLMHHDGPCDTRHTIGQGGRHQFPGPVGEHPLKPWRHQ